MRGRVRLSPDTYTTNQRDIMKIEHGDTGFHVTTSTGFVLSVQYGPGNYCENYATFSYSPKGCKVPEVETVEIAIWRTDDQQFIRLGNDDVAGYVPVSLIPKIMLDLEENNLAVAIHRITSRELED
jgi:hypothetical protein